MYVRFFFTGRAMLQLSSRATRRTYLFIRKALARAIRGKNCALKPTFMQHPKEEGEAYVEEMEMSENLRSSPSRARVEP